MTEPIEYQAITSRPEAVARAQAVRGAIARLGGTLDFSPPTSTGMVVITLRLPLPYKPEDVLPHLPFFPV